MVILGYLEFPLESRHEMRGACASISRVAGMRRESGGGVSCGGVLESIRNEGREGCDADRELPWGCRDESRGAL